MTHAGANAGNLVRRHADAHARAADENAARCIAALERLTHLLRKIGIVVGQVAGIRAQVNHFVPRLGKIGAHLLLQRKARMVRTDN